MQWAVDTSLEHSLGHQRVKVDVRVERRAAALDRRYRSAAALDAILARPAALETQQRPRKDRENGAAKAMILNQLVTPSVRKRQNAIADSMDQLSYLPQDQRGKESDAAIRKRVTDLSLPHALITRWTAVVAVTESILNPSPAHAMSAAVPVPMVAGITELAYPRSHQVSVQVKVPQQHPQNPTQLQNRRRSAPAQVARSGSSKSRRSYPGSGSPQPATTASLLVAAGAGLAGLRPRRRD